MQSRLFHRFTRALPNASFNALVLLDDDPSILTLFCSRACGLGGYRIYGSTAMLLMITKTKDDLILPGGHRVRTIIESQVFLLSVNLTLVAVPHSVFA